LHIELTDHLRCPADHPESFLVLIPGEMRGREVRRGVLGCPVCQREYPIVDGVVHFTPQAPLPSVPLNDGAVNADAIAAFLGLEGPGGYVGLVGNAVGFSPGLAPLWPGIHLVAVNPPEGFTPSERTSVLLSPALPFKARSLRGIVVGEPYGSEAPWRETAVGAVLPGLRAAGQGPLPVAEKFELLGEAAGWWVGRAGK
jgi:uncharacterized protein YbaR (Trm112 family)